MNHPMAPNLNWKKKNPKIVGKNHLTDKDVTSSSQMQTTIVLKWIEISCHELISVLVSQLGQLTCWRSVQTHDQHETQGQNGMKWNDWNWF